MSHFTRTYSWELAILIFFSKSYFHELDQNLRNSRKIILPKKFLLKVFSVNFIHLRLLMTLYTNPFVSLISVT